MEQFDVVILGAGAAGLMCAIRAAERGRRVLVLEKSNKAGKKILMSGGGRCNFTNLYIDPDRFLSANPHFCKSALSQYSQWDFIALVDKYRIPWHEKTLGQLFCDRSAKDIVDMLLAECRRLDITLLTQIEPEIIRAEQPFQLQDQNTGRQWQAQSLVIATGGLSIPTLGGSALGYQLAEQLGFEVLPLRAGLVPFTLTDELGQWVAELSGVSLFVDVRVGDKSFKENLLFTHRGLSGPAILQASSYWQPGETVRINLVPAEEMPGRLKICKQEEPKKHLHSVMMQWWPRQFAKALAVRWWSDLIKKPMAQIPDQRLTELGHKMNAWEVKPAGTEGYRTAEVTLGGISTEHLSSKTMACKSIAGLYFIGEVVDVTGHLGGFNFQWAWSSGWVAGQNV